MYAMSICKPCIPLGCCFRQSSNDSGSYVLKKTEVPKRLKDKERSSTIIQKNLFKHKEHVQNAQQIINDEKMKNGFGSNKCNNCWKEDTLRRNISYDSTFPGYEKDKHSQQIAEDKRSQAMTYRELFDRSTSSNSEVEFLSSTSALNDVTLEDLAQYQEVQKVHEDLNIVTALDNHNYQIGLRNAGNSKVSEKSAEENQSNDVPCNSQMSKILRNSDRESGSAQTNNLEEINVISENKHHGDYSSRVTLGAIPKFGSRIIKHGSSLNTESNELSLSQPKEVVHQNMEVVKVQHSSENGDIHSVQLSGPELLEWS